MAISNHAYVTIHPSADTSFTRLIQEYRVTNIKTEYRQIPDFGYYNYSSPPISAQTYSNYADGYSHYRVEAVHTITIDGAAMKKLDGDLSLLEEANEIAKREAYEKRMRGLHPSLNDLYEQYQVAIALYD